MSKMLSPIRYKIITWPLQVLRLRIYTAYTLELVEPGAVKSHITQGVVLFNSDLPKQVLPGVKLLYFSKDLGTTITSRASWRTGIMSKTARSIIKLFWSLYMIVLLFIL